MSNQHIVCPHCHTVNRIPAGRLHQQPKCGHCKQPLFIGKPVALTASTFQTHITRSDLPVVVDFWADWCGPCNMMAPAYQQAAANLEPQLRFAKLNTEQEQGIAAQYQIRSIPTLVLFKQGREIARQAGAMAAGDIARWLNAYL